MASIGPTSHHARVLSSEDKRHRVHCLAMLLRSIQNTADGIHWSQMVEQPVSRASAPTAAHHIAVHEPSGDGANEPIPTHPSETASLPEVHLLTIKKLRFRLDMATVTRMWHPEGGKPFEALVAPFVAKTVSSISNSTLRACDRAAGAFSRLSARNPLRSNHSTPGAIPPGASSVSLQGSG